MSKTPMTVRDRRSRLDLDLFVLALIERGIATPYALLAKVGLSPGATLPVLARIESGGYVRRGKSLARGRAEYKITAAGRRFLQTGWRPLIDAPIPADVEAILRTAALALMSGAEESMVSDYLKKAAEAKSQDSKDQQTDAKVAAKARPASVDGQLYAWMRAFHSAARLKTDVKVLRDLANRIKQIENP